MNQKFTHESIKALAPQVIAILEREFANHQNQTKTVLHSVQNYYDFAITLAGGAVASAVFEALDLKINTRYKDLDIFVCTGNECSISEPYKSPKARISNPVVEVVENSFNSHVSTYKQGYVILGASMHGKLNFIEVSHYNHSDPFSNTILQGFDLDCTQVALENNELVFTEAFLSFLTHQIIHATTNMTAMHSLVRIHEKGMQLGVNISTESVDKLCRTIMTKQVISQALTDESVKLKNKNTSLARFGGWFFSDSYAKRFKHAYELFSDTTKELVSPNLSEINIESRPNNNSDEIDEFTLYTPVIEATKLPEHIDVDATRYLGELLAQKVLNLCDIKLLQQKLKYIGFDSILKACWTDRIVDIVNAHKEHPFDITEAIGFFCNGNGTQWNSHSILRFMRIIERPSGSTFVSPPITERIFESNFGQSIKDTLDSLEYLYTHHLQLMTFLSHTYALYERDPYIKAIIRNLDNCDNLKLVSAKMEYLNKRHLERIESTIDVRALFQDHENNTNNSLPPELRHLESLGMHVTYSLVDNLSQYMNCNSKLGQYEYCPQRPPRHTEPVGFIWIKTSMASFGFPHEPVYALWHIQINHPLSQDGQFKIIGRFDLNVSNKAYQRVVTKHMDSTVMPKLMEWIMSQIEIQQVFNINIASQQDETKPTKSHKLEWLEECPF
ncbi:hypothetical protein AB4254_08135 [Vibrio breoganii]